MANITINEENVAYIRENWKKTNDTDYAVDLGTYSHIMNERGITRDVEDRVDQARTATVYELTRAATAQLKEDIAAAKDAGKDPKEVRVQAKMRVPNGSTRVRVTGAKACRHPGTGERCWSPCHTSITYTMHAPFEKEFHAKAIEEVRELCDIEDKKE